MLTYVIGFIVTLTVSMFFTDGKFWKECLLVSLIWPFAIGFAFARHIRNRWGN